MISDKTWISNPPHTPLGGVEKNGRLRGESVRGETRGKETKGGTPRLTLEKVLSSVPIPLLLRTDEFIRAWTEWIEHRIEYGKLNRCHPTTRSFTDAVRDCDKWGLDRALNAIKFSIGRSYRGLCEPRFRMETKPKHVEGTIRTGVQGRVY